MIEIHKCIYFIKKISKRKIQVEKKKKTNNRNTLMIMLYLFEIINLL